MQDGVPVIVCVGELKAPQKLTLKNIENGLDLEDLVVRKDGKTLKDVTHRLVAAIICQTYSYMVEAGLKFGYFKCRRIPAQFIITCQFLAKTLVRAPDGRQKNPLHMAFV